MMLSEGEGHVRAMRLVCQALEEHEGQGLEVDWDVLYQQLDHMDTILQGIADQRRDDAEEIQTLRKERDAALAAVSLQRAGIERLKAFVGKVRNGDVLQALAELEAETSEPEEHQ